MAFKKIRSIKLSYAKQGQIYFSLLNYRDMPGKIRAKIDGLIREAARGEPEYEQALRQWLIDGERWDRVTQEHYTDAGALCRMRKYIYEHW